MYSGAHRGFRRDFATDDDDDGDDEPPPVPESVPRIFQKPRARGEGGVHALGSAPLGNALSRLYARGRCESAQDSSSSSSSSTSDDDSRRRGRQRRRSAAVAVVVAVVVVVARGATLGLETALAAFALVTR